MIAIFIGANGSELPETFLTVIQASTLWCFDLRYQCGIHHNSGDGMSRRQFKSQSSSPSSYIQYGGGSLLWLISSRSRYPKGLEHHAVWTCPTRRLFSVQYPVKQRCCCCCCCCCCHSCFRLPRRKYSSCWIWMTPALAWAWIEFCRCRCR